MQNPLLEISDLPNKAPAFSKIKTEHYLPAVQAAIEEARQNIERMKNNPQAPDFENTIVALETASETLGQVTSVFYNQMSAVGGDDLHELAQEIGPICSAFSNDIGLDPDIFARVKTVYDARDTLNLNAEEQTLLRDTYKGFVRGGALLDDTAKARYREISAELSTLGPDFMNNATKSGEEFELRVTDEASLSGLPESALNAAKQAANEAGYEGEFLFTLEYPSYIPFMQYADNRTYREKMWRAFTSRGWSEDGKGQYDNSENILKIISLKYERAKLLGYDTHADFVLEERMAKTPAQVLEFLNKLVAAYKPAAQEDLKNLQNFAKEEGLSEPLKPWDLTYYSEKLKQKLFNFSSEDLRPYFELDRTLEGCFTHFSKLFDVRFEPSNAYDVWHDDVKAFDLYSNKDNSFVGTLFGDFFPRKGKKDGAWKTSYRNQGLFNGKIERPVIAIVCNFTKPAGDTPSLLTFGEVETLFHEMGHAMHALLSDVTYSSHAGTSVRWDFVELPSQLQENWCTEKETLDLFAQHYKTGEKIPEELIEKVVKSKNFMVGWGGLRQVNFGIMDMAWHSRDPATINDVAAFEDEVTAGTSLFPRLSGPMSCSFNHIFAGGYSAGYYSYKWAEVLDADAFEAFKEAGLYDHDTAARYRDELLSKGGSLEPDVLYRNFRGRDADANALLRREGLLDEKAA